METTSTKTCTKCGRTLPLLDFYADKKNTDEHRNWCKDCCKKLNKENYSRLTAQKSEKKTELSKFTSRQLINELIDRGYSGELTYTQKVRLIK